MVYTIDSKQGRSAKIDNIRITKMLVSTTATMLPTTPLGRRTYIRIKNLDYSTDIAILTASGIYDNGYPVGISGSELELNTNANLYIVSAAGTVDVRVIEISKAI